MKLQPNAFACTVFTAVKASAWLKKSRAPSAAGADAARAAPVVMASMFGAAPPALLDAKDAKEKPPLSADEIRLLERTRERGQVLVREDKRFTGIVDKYWAAMTGNAYLTSVQFSMYEKVHMRIYKTMAKNEGAFNEEDAIQMARDDFESDTGGISADGRLKLMDRPMLTYSCPGPLGAFKRP